MFFWTAVILGMLIVPAFRKFAWSCISLAIVVWGAIFVLGIIS